MNLSPILQSFVLHFGEMGGKWGVNRTVGQIYALLFLADRALNAEDIVEALGVSRSNVSMGLKELEAWRLVRKRHLPGDRRDHFETSGDVWTILRTVAEERRKREIDPTLSMLREVLMETPASPEERHAQERMREMHDMIELLTGWSDDVARLPDAELLQLLKRGARVGKLLELKGRFGLASGARKVGAGAQTEDVE
jgi:DNA-binding transcriptional regulator GbsR (MarR family)